jgi:hypothetical protein
MRNKITVNCLLVVLIASIAFPYSLIASASTVTIDPKLVMKWNRLSHNWLTLKTPSQVEHGLAQVNFNFNPSFKKQDEKFMEILALQTTELPLIKVKDDKYEIYDVSSHRSKATVQIIGQNKFSLNGKGFEYDINSSLESNLEKIKMLLDGEKVSVWDQVFIPNGHAGMKGAVNGFLIGLAALMVFAVIYNYKTDKGEKSEKSNPPNGHVRPAEFQDF